ncbi:pentatricopeptide repeat-containing protein-like [Iris pallida]|uniref:Pentatricopeptide repeat-containing protein-like n=1 Tax=Iris pallida TaxID=29817 RepID=A0AAX6HBD9_IRIPA|nr:pentatricopeptide repeat-containing protein-like [Iris pallida]
MRSTIHNAQATCKSMSTSITRIATTNTTASKLMSILKECYDASDLRRGQQVHAQAFVSGLADASDSLHTRVLGMYVLCGSLSDAKDVFFRGGGVDRGSSLPWNWMIRGFTSAGRFEHALLFYSKMWLLGAVPCRYTFPHVLKCCSSLRDVDSGIMVHATIRSLGLEGDLFVGSSLIKMYAEHGRVEDARRVFDGMPDRDCVCWNVMIDGYVRIGDRGKAVELFNSMRAAESSENSVSLTCLLSICAAEAMLKYGTQIHGLAIRCGLESEAQVANTLLAMYSKCRCLDEVRRLFDSMPHNDLIAWNGMISGYVQNGLKNEALELFCRMQASGVKPDGVTLASFLPSFSDSVSLKQGKEIHAYMLRNGIDMDAFLKSALIDIYFKSKEAELAEKVFFSSGTVDVVIFSAMISGYVLNGLSRSALEMFRHLLEARLKPNAISLASVLPACSCMGALKLGKELHGYVLKHGFVERCYVTSALVDMYAKCGRLDLGHQIFAQMSIKDSVAWNSMIANLAQNGQLDEAIDLFRQMGVEGVRYDNVTISAALSACANLPSLHHGKEIHGFMMRCDLRSDLFAESALIDMYAKCGHLSLARTVFDSMDEKSEVSWNSIIAAYGTHGLVGDAICLFEQMEKVGFRPDHVTFLALISACAHAGKVEEGYRIFCCMNEKYGIVARMEHYSCMVDLFARAGKLSEALNFITNMPFKPDAGIWGALLGACRVHRNVELAELASKHLFELEPQNSGYYVLMSNINAVAGRWDGVLRVRSLMKERKVQKIPGYSWIDINNTSHMFVAADKSHPESTHIYLCMKSLVLDLEEEGYVPQPDLVYPLHMDLRQQVAA